MIFFCKELGWAIDYYRNVVMFNLYWCVKKCFIKQDYFWGSKKLVGKPCLNFRLFYWEVIKAYPLLKWQKLRSSSKQLERNYYCYDWFFFAWIILLLYFFIPLYVPPLRWILQQSLVFYVVGGYCIIFQRFPCGILANIINTNIQQKQNLYTKVKGFMWYR